MPKADEFDALSWLFYLLFSCCSFFSVSFIGCLKSNTFASSWPLPLNLYLCPHYQLSLLFLQQLSWPCNICCLCNFCIPRGAKAGDFTNAFTMIVVSNQIASVIVLHKRSNSRMKLKHFISAHVIVYACACILPVGLYGGQEAEF